MSGKKSLIKTYYQQEKHRKTSFLFESCSVVVSPAAEIVIQPSIAPVVVPRTKNSILIEQANCMIMSELTMILIIPDTDDEQPDRPVQQTLQRRAVVREQPIHRFVLYNGSFIIQQPSGGIIFGFIVWCARWDKP